MPPGAGSGVSFKKRRIGVCMTASGLLPNQWLQMLDAAGFDLLRPHLVTINLVSETVLGGRRGTACALPFRSRAPVGWTDDRGGDTRSRQHDASATTAAACGRAHNTALGDCPTMTVNTEPIANISH